MELEEEMREIQGNEETRKLIEGAAEIDEMEFLKTKSNKTLVEKAKVMLYESLQKYGFITILLCASIPNPLFDLAGITCGHFRISFRKFFTATLIGKAIIKVHLQIFFVITCFRKEAVAYLIGFLEKFSVGFASAISSGIEKQKESLYKPKGNV
jgi:hypothetical protein